MIHQVVPISPHSFSTHTSTSSTHTGFWCVIKAPAQVPTQHFYLCISLHLPAPQPPPPQGFCRAHETLLKNNRETPTTPRRFSGTGRDRAARAGGVRAGPRGCCRTDSHPRPAPRRGPAVPRGAAGALEPPRALPSGPRAPPATPPPPSCCPSARLARSLRRSSPFVATAPFPRYGHLPQPFPTPPSPGAPGGAPRGTPPPPRRSGPPGPSGLAPTCPPPRGPRPALPALQALPGDPPWSPAHGQARGDLGRAAVAEEPARLRRRLRHLPYPPAPPPARAAAPTAAEGGQGTSRGANAEGSEG